MAAIAISAGGTGGHVFPGLSLAEELRKRGHEVVLVTDQRGEKLTKDFSGPRLVVQAKSPSKKNPLKLAGAVFGLLTATAQARKFLKRHEVAVVAGFGGYPSFPALLAGKTLGLPLILHEQNAVLGRANRLFAPWAARIASGFDRLERLKPEYESLHVVTGNPVRKEILAIKAVPAKTGEARLLMLGGSLGARILSDTLPAAIALLPGELKSRLVVTAQMTADRIEGARNALAREGVQTELATFFPDVADKLARADLVIARAGASSVAEIAACGLPAIFVPLKIAMDDHQTANAKVLANVGAADIVAEEKLTPERIAALISARFADKKGLAKRGSLAKTAAKQDAASQLAQLVEAELE